MCVCHGEEVDVKRASWEIREMSLVVVKMDNTCFGDVIFKRENIYLYKY